MNRIGLLGGTSWPSTMEYYRLLNQLAAERLGGYHSARLLLYNIDYHPIKSSYASGWDNIPDLLYGEIRRLESAGAESLIICNNTLHKAFDEIEESLALSIPVFHAVRLTADEAVQTGKTRVLLLATKFTMEDSFFRTVLEQRGVEVHIPDLGAREKVQVIQSELAQGIIRPEFAQYFSSLIEQYKHLDAVVLACTELPLVITPRTSALSILNPLELQCRAAMDWALA